jgi:type I restriction enzyme R subunit
VDSFDKKNCSEIDNCDLFITPALKQAGWNQFKQIRREVTLTPGPVIVRGNLSSSTKKKKSSRIMCCLGTPGSRSPL